MSRERASLHAENRHPHAARGPPNFQPSGPLSSIRFRPQDGLRPLCFVQPNGMGHSAGQSSGDFATGGVGASLKRLIEGHRMARRRKTEGKAIARIRDARTREIVGYLFEWNTGDIDPKWNDDVPRDEKDVVYEYA